VRGRLVAGSGLLLGSHQFFSSVSAAGASAASAFFADFLAGFAGASTGAGVARMPSSR